MDQVRPNFFSGPYIDRRAEAREEPGWLDAALSDPATLYLLAKGTTQLVQTKPEPRIEFLTREHPIVREVEPRQFILLGWFRGTRCVLIEIEPERSVSVPATATFEELRPLSPLGRRSPMVAYIQGGRNKAIRHRNGTAVWE